ncbi:hypothetical protein ACP275_06G037500 [Erythranthe tilingii]
MNAGESSHQFSGMTQAEIAEYVKNFLPEFGDLDVDEVLLLQESALYAQDGKQKNVTSDHGQKNEYYIIDGESSHGPNVDEQLAIDEALARSLEFVDDFDDLCISEPVTTAVDHNRGSTSRQTPIAGTEQHMIPDDIDPDRMTYEELQSLGESVGSESKGLPADQIALLPTFKYKTGSKKNKKEKEDCVICCAPYKSGAEMTTLPCAHHYHTECITHWLELNKHCPVCQKEVEVD